MKPTRTMHDDNHPTLGAGILDHDTEMLVPRHELGQTSWDSSFSRRNPTIREFMLNSKKSFDSITRRSSLDVSSHPLPLRSQAIVNGP